MHQLETIFGRMASATDVPCKAQVESLVAQVSSESGKDVPTETQVGQASQKVTRLQREFAQAVEARQNAERLLSDTERKPSASRTTYLPTAGIGHHVLEPDAANQIILETELDLTDDERAACRCCWRARQVLYVSDF